MPAPPLQVVMDKHTRRSKGYAFVSYRFVEDANRSLGGLRRQAVICLGGRFWPGDL
jgi:hypothetical protein